MTELDSTAKLQVTPLPPAAVGGIGGLGFLAPLMLKLRDLAVLLLALVTLLFLLLPQAGDPAQVLAGMDATSEQIAAIRAKYGLDQPLYVQYVRYWSNVLQLDFGTSLASGQPAMGVVLSHLPATLLLAGLAMGFTICVSVPMGAWLGFRPDVPSRRFSAWLVFVLQGVPGFVFGLVLIQIFAVNLRWLPSFGYDEVKSWILPTLSLSFFLVPKLTRVVAANVAEAMREDFVRTARAFGASRMAILWRHALPNALLGAAALVGTQFAFLLSGAVIIERIFGWPGIGWLLIERTQTLDFPVVQALAMLIAVMVFTVNTVTDMSFRFLDPRIRSGTTR